ncbi:MAG TPA: hypothetical protein VKY89_14145 [Thermoanaerobaculia bacterium]|jgi:hypothetical protein|nr:hypothetical protein [Thermoanaerobaculia bacterium]
MSPSFTATGAIVNNTPYDLSVVSSALDSGRWIKTPLTVAASSTNDQAFVATIDPGSPAGVAGQVVYNINGSTPSTNVTLNFDDPYSSSNSASASSSTPGFSATASVPPAGSEVIFTYTVSAT